MGNGKWEGDENENNVRPLYIYITYGLPTGLSTGFGRLGVGIRGPWVHSRHRQVFLFR